MPASISGEMPATLSLEKFISGSLTFLGASASAGRAQLYRADSRAGTGIEDEDLLAAIGQDEVHGDTRPGRLHGLNDRARRQVKNGIEGRRFDRGEARFGTGLGRMRGTDYDRDDEGERAADQQHAENDHQEPETAHRSGLRASDEGRGGGKGDSFHAGDPAQH